MTTTTTGDFNESGIIAAWGRQGFSIPKCLMELISNCIDADSNQIKICVDDKCIRIIDDGIGMHRNGVEYMFTMFRENHKYDKSTGAFGVGGKIAPFVISNKTKSYVFTKMKDNQYLKVVCPWGEIASNGKYTNMIQISPMTEDEIKTFCNERHPNVHGTTIELPLNNELIKVIRENFIPVDCDTKVLDKVSNKLSDIPMCMVFGKFSTSITC